MKSPWDLLLTKRVPEVARKNIFFWPMNGKIYPGNCFALLHEVVFFIDRSSCFSHATGRFSWRVSEEKKFNDAEEIAYGGSSISFLGGFIEGIS